MKPFDVPAETDGYADFIVTSRAPAVCGEFVFCAYGLDAWLDYVRRGEPLFDDVTEDLHVTYGKNGRAPLTAIEE